MRLPRPRHSTVVAYLALFVAMSGTAYAATGGTFTLGHHNSATASTGLTNTRRGPALTLQTRDKNTPALSVGNKARIKNLNADELDGVTSTQLRAQAVKGRLPAHYVAVSARLKFNLANGAALRAALARPTASGEVILLDAGEYNVGDKPLVIPNGVSLVGAGSQLSTILTTRSIQTGTGTDLRELSISASGTSKDLAVLDVSNTSDASGGVQLSDVDIDATSTAPGLTGILAGQAFVVADDVNLDLLTSTSSSTALASDDGDIVFRNGYIAANHLGGGAGGDGYLDPQIVDTSFDTLLAKSLTKDDGDYCSGDYSDVSNNFSTVPDGAC